VYAQYAGSPGDGIASIGIGTQTIEGYLGIQSKEVANSVYRPYLTVTTAAD